MPGKHAVPNPVQTAANKESASAGMSLDEYIISEMSKIESNNLSAVGTSLASVLSQVEDTCKRNGHSPQEMEAHKREAVEIFFRAYSTSANRQGALSRAVGPYAPLRHTDKTY